jgi:hypothetical protein
LNADEFYLPHDSAELIGRPDPARDRLKEEFGSPSHIYEGRSYALYDGSNRSLHRSPLRPFTVGKG